MTFSKVDVALGLSICSAGAAAYMLYNMREISSTSSVKRKQHYPSPIPPPSTVRRKLNKLKTLKRIAPKLKEVKEVPTMMESEMTLSESEEIHPGKYDSVIKIFVTSVAPSFSEPWRYESQESWTGSGFIVLFEEQGYVITNAHVAEYAADIRVRKPACPTKYSAQLLCLSQELDLAILQVDSEDFWDGLEPVELELTAPDLGESVSVIGYPKGADALCVTRGVVSRIVMDHNREGGSQICKIQIDASINSGNSGGPVMDENLNVVGVATETLEDAENVGFIVASVHVIQFLQDYCEHGRFQGIPNLSLEIQTLENHSLRKFCNILADVDDGILITKVGKMGSGAALKPQDVLLSIDGVRVGRDGTVAFDDEDRSRERLAHDWCVSTRRCGETIELEFLRNGDLMTVECFLKPLQLKMKSELYFDHQREYYIFAGFVFSVLSAELMMEYELHGVLLDNPGALSMVEHEDEQLVVISSILSHPINHGYEELELCKIKTINGVTPKNIKHCKSLLHEKEQVVIQIHECSVIVVDREEALKSNKEIMETFNIQAISNISF